MLTKFDSQQSPEIVVIFNSTKFTETIHHAIFSPTQVVISPLVLIFHNLQGIELT